MKNRNMEIDIGSLFTSNACVSGMAARLFKRIYFPAQIYHRNGKISLCSATRILCHKHRLSTLTAKSKNPQGALRKKWTVSSSMLNRQLSTDGGDGNNKDESTSSTLEKMKEQEADLQESVGDMREKATELQEAVGQMVEMEAQQMEAVGEVIGQEVLQEAAGEVIEEQEVQQEAVGEVKEKKEVMQEAVGGVMGKGEELNEASKELVEGDEDELYRFICLEIKGHDKAVMNSYVTFIAAAARELSLQYEVLSQRESPRSDYFRKGLLKSVHIQKSAFVHYEIRTHYRIVHLKYLTGTTASVVLEYIERNLPEGMAIKVTKHKLMRLPDYLIPPPQEEESTKSISQS